MSEPTFDDFWTAWPRKVSKKPAQKAWDKLQPDQQRAAIADVEKRNRFKAWSPNARLIPHAATYLNQERFCDEWEAELASSTKSDDDRPNTGVVDYRPIEDTFAGTKWDALANRWCLRWFYVFCMRRGRGMQTEELEQMLTIKRRCIDEMSAALDEDLAADKGRDAQIDAIWTFLGVLVGRLDAAFETEYKPMLMRG